MFDSTNEQIGEIAGQVGLTPQAWNSGIFNMIQNLSNNVILPLAGAILAIVMTLELIQLITDRNNLNDVDTWMFFKWVFKSAAAVLIVSNTWTIVMGIFDAAQSVVNGAAGVMIGNTSIDISSVVTDLESRLMKMDVGPLLGLWFQSLFVGICTWAITICIFIVIYGRMIEVYLVTSVAPIPMATMANREWGQMGQNYLRTLQSRNQRMFLVTFLILNTADTKRQLDNNVFQTNSIAQKYNCSITALDYQQEEGLVSSLPLGLNQIEIQRGLTSSGVAIFVPFTTQELLMDICPLYFSTHLRTFSRPYP